MPGDEDVRVRALVTGRVQGVFFREFTRSHAVRLGIAGLVRNLVDGMSVEVVAEGPRPRLEELLSRLREGPPGALVQRVEVSWEPARSDLRSFQIR